MLEIRSVYSLCCLGYLLAVSVLYIYIYIYIYIYMLLFCHTTGWPPLSLVKEVCVDTLTSVRLAFWHPKVLWRCSNDYEETNPYCALRQHSFDIFISRTETPKHLVTVLHTDKSLARPGRKQATATGDFDFHVSYL